MRRLLLLVTGVLAPSLSIAAPSLVAPDDPRVAAAARAVGCKVDPYLRFAAALASWPGAEDSARWIVATSSNPHQDDDLGQLCVGVVRSVGPAFAKVATLSAPGPRTPAEIQPVSDVYVVIDRTPYHYAPGQTAFAVWVTGELNTTSVNVHYTTTYLYSISGNQIAQIFSSELGDGTIDKVGETEETRYRVIKFSSRMTHGAFDLLISDKSHRRFKRYIWTGSRYAQE